MLTHNEQIQQHILQSCRLAAAALDAAQVQHSFTATCTVTRAQCKRPPLWTCTPLRHGRRRIAQPNTGYVAPCFTHTFPREFLSRHGRNLPTTHTHPTLTMGTNTTSQGTVQRSTGAAAVSKARSHPVLYSHDACPTSPHTHTPTCTTTHTYTSHMISTHNVVSTHLRQQKPHPHTYYIFHAHMIAPPRAGRPGHRRSMCGTIIRTLPVPPAA